MNESVERLFALGMLDSRLKLHLLLLLYRHPRVSYTASALSDRLAEPPWGVEAALEDLTAHGFLERVRVRDRMAYRLRERAANRRALDTLAADYDDPLRRDRLYQLIRDAERERLFYTWTTTTHERAVGDF
jgi:DNA-binding MarR family transcriptional regulator